jgi:hypothetical protein
MVQRPFRVRAPAIDENGKPTPPIKIVEPPEPPLPPWMPKPR